MKQILDIGCGKNKAKIKGAEVIGIDIAKIDGVIQHDLNKFPWPFKDNSFDEVIASHIVEHLDDVFKSMEEIHRVLKKGGVLKLYVPYFSNSFSYADPTHKHFFTLYTLNYWDRNSIVANVLNYYTNVRFNIRKRRLHFEFIPNPKTYKIYRKSHKWTFLKLRLFNIVMKRFNKIFTMFNNVYEHTFLCYMIPAKEIYAEMVKE